MTMLTTNNWRYYGTTSMGSTLCIECKTELLDSTVRRHWKPGPGVQQAEPFARDGPGVGARPKSCTVTSNSDWAGTRVPTNTGVPLMISGSL